LLEETDAWSHGKMHAASGTLGICSGGPLCSLENGCDSCDLESGFKWVDVRFPDGIFSAQPLVLSQVQTFHGPNWVTTRHRTVSPTGFGMAMEGAGMTSGHMTEEIGYLAVPAGGGSLHGLGYEARITRTVVRLCPALPCPALRCIAYSLAGSLTSKFLPRVACGTGVVDRAFDRMAEDVCVASVFLRTDADVS